MSSTYGSDKPFSSFAGRNLAMYRWKRSWYLVSIGWMSLPPRPAFSTSSGRPRMIEKSRKPGISPGPKKSWHGSSMKGTHFGTKSLLEIFFLLAS